MNEVVKKETELEQQGLVEMSGNYFEQYGSIAAQTAITGTLIKFSKGDWLLGPDEEPLDVGTQFTAVMSELQIGWIKWVDSKPEEQIMGKVAEGFQPPRRKDLGDTDDTEWDVDSQGRPRDPWQFSNHLVLRKVGTDGADEDDLYTFATSSRGGINAIGELCKAYGKQFRQRAGQFPIIELGVDSYVHSNKEYGRIKIPLLKLVDWEAIAPDKKTETKSEKSEKSSTTKPSAKKPEPEKKAAGKSRR